MQMYADDIVYAIAEVMKDKDDKYNKNENNVYKRKRNESFKNLMDKADIEGKIEDNFKCPLFDGPCFPPYDLNIFYVLGDCTGELAGGLHNVAFRNNRIHTPNYFSVCYYKDGSLVQKYGYHYDDTDLHIFSLEDISAFRDEDENGEYKYSDREGQYFFECMNFILEEKKKIEKEKRLDELDVYIEKDASSSIYIKNNVEAITKDGVYSNNENLLHQNYLTTLQKLNPDINVEEKIEEVIKETKKKRTRKKEKNNV